MISEGCPVSSLSQLPPWRTKKDPNTMFLKKFDFSSKKDQRMILKMIDFIIDMSLMEMKGVEVLDKINSRAYLRRDLDLTQSEIYQLIDTLEQKLQITIKDDDRIDITTVSQLEAIIFLGLFEESGQKD